MSCSSVSFMKPGLNWLSDIWFGENFLHFGWPKAGVFLFHYFCNLGYNPLPSKNRVFSPECFCDWRNEVLVLSCSLLLYCVVLVTFDPLYFYIVTVCKDDLWSGGFVGTSRWNVSIVTCNCKDRAEAQLVSCILCSWYTEIYIPTSKEAYSYFQKFLWTYLLKLCQSSLNLFWLEMSFLHPVLYNCVTLLSLSFTMCCIREFPIDF